jgi:hypothetical protein
MGSAGTRLAAFTVKTEVPLLQSFTVGGAAAARATRRRNML